MNVLNLFDVSYAFDAETGNYVQTKPVQCSHKWKFQKKPFAIISNQRGQLCDACMKKVKLRLEMEKANQVYLKQLREFLSQSS